MNVNDECLKNKSECQALLTITKATKKTDSKTNHPRGNPASDFCELLSGSYSLE